MNPQNAIIDSCDILATDRYMNCLCISIGLKLQRGGIVCLSIYCVYTKDYERNQMGYAIQRIMEIVKTNDWSEVVGKPVRALFERDGRLGDTIIGIGNFLEEDWFVPREEKIFKSE